MVTYVQVSSMQCEDQGPDDPASHLLELTVQPEPELGRRERSRARHSAVATVLAAILCSTVVVSNRWWTGPRSSLAEEVSAGRGKTWRQEMTKLDDSTAGVVDLADTAATNTSQASHLPDSVMQKFVTTETATVAVPAAPAVEPEPQTPEKNVVEICPPPEQDTDYKVLDISSQEDVASKEECQTLCTKDAECGAWSWGEAQNTPSIAHRCFLKQLVERGDHGAVPAKGIVSGLPCRSSAVRRPRTKFPGQFPAHSIYCFALMQPTGYELGLTTMQFEQGVSIFSCDEYALYSNKVLEVVPGVFTHQVDSDLKCEYGGEFMTALNTPIFFAVWDKVVEDGRFKLHEWTVKADPDCVFFPSRLRIILEAYSPPPSSGAYFNNCKFGMHGPLEIFSAKAVEVWGSGKSQCSDYFNNLCSGDCLWGEDMFVDQCLQRVFKMARWDDWGILVEDHCDPPKGWESCEDRSKVSFHPFKTQSSYLQCLRGSGALEESAGV